MRYHSYPENFLLKAMENHGICRDCSCVSVSGTECNNAGNATRLATGCFGRFTSSEIRSITCRIASGGGRTTDNKPSLDLHLPNSVQGWHLSFQTCVINEVQILRFIHLNHTGPNELSIGVSP